MTRRKQPKPCERCNEKPAAIRFCDDCVREISRSYERGAMMDRMRAGTFYCNNARYPSRKMEVAMVLNVLNPEMSMDKIMEVTRAVED